jgi:hypothetical protein
VIFTLVPLLRCALQRSAQNYVVKRRKKRLTELILANCCLAESSLLPCCIVHDPDIGVSPTIAIATFGCHESLSAFKAVLANLKSACMLTTGSPYY